MFLKKAFSAYSRIVDVIDMSQRADLCAVAIHLFSGGCGDNSANVDLLHDETPNMDLAGACLPCLKLILDQTFASQVPTVTATSERVVHGLLGSCLNNVDEMRTRVNPVASVKIKNNLLALVLVLSTLPLGVEVSKPVVEQICSDIGRYMGAAKERPELGLTPVHCATTLLQASLRQLPGHPPRPSPVLQYAALCVLAPMISYISDTVVAFAAAGDPASVPLEGVREMLGGLVGWVNGMSEELKPRGYGVLVPTICVLLDPGEPSEHSALHVLATGTMLGLAQSAPQAFKDATQAMPEGERSSLERAVRETVQRQQQPGGGEKRGGGIALRSFG